MTNKLFKKNEQGKLYIEFNTNALLRGNPKERADYYRTMLNIGAMSINEIRQKENLNVVEQGDNLFMQLNMATVDTIIKGNVKKEDIQIDEDKDEDIDENKNEEIVEESFTQKTNGVLKK